MNSQGLPPVLLSAGKRYSTSIPEGKLSQGSASQIPVVSRKGSGKANPLSMRDIMTDQNLIDKKLKSLSNTREADYRVSLQTQRKQKANLKFLKYKFNPGTQGEGDNLQRDTEQELYGQLGSGTKQKITSQCVISRLKGSINIQKIVYLERGKSLTFLGKQGWSC